VTALRLRALGELRAVQRTLQERQRQQQAQAQAQQAAQRQAASDHELFVRSVGPVRPLPDKRRVHLHHAAALPVQTRQQRDEQALMHEALSDDFDVSTLLEADELLSFRRAGVGPDVPKRLRRGEWSIQRQLDLHGLRREQARNVLGQFIREAHGHGIRCVRVVHGKGLGSPGKTPVLKSRVHSWLVQKSEVIAFVQAKPADGGAGALLVLLAPRRQVC
jgi:DNA-nicking Smr family endonuclease